MNASDRKSIKNQYKKTEFEKGLSSDNPVISKFAKRELNIPSAPLTIDVIEKVSGYDLLELIYDKINEVIEKTYKQDQQRYKNTSNAFKILPNNLQWFYNACVFEMQLEIGDIDKFFLNASNEEIQSVSNWYKILGFEDIAKLILNIGNEEANFRIFEQKFTLLKNAIHESATAFIKSNAETFQLV